MLSRFTIFLIIPLFFTFCASRQIKDEKSLKQNREQALKGDKQSFENYEKALEKPVDRDITQQDIDLEKKVLIDLGSIPSEKSTEILLKHAEDDNPEIRSTAIDALISQKSISKEPEKVEREILDVIRKNQETYKDLTHGEINALSAIPNRDSLDLLLGQLIRDKDADPFLVRKLGELFTTSRRNIIQDQNVTDFDREAASKIGAALLAYLKAVHSRSSRENVLIELSNAFEPDSNARLLEIYKDNAYDEDVKLLALKILALKSAPQIPKILKDLKKEYLSTRTEENRLILLGRMGVIDPENLVAIKNNLDLEIVNRIKQKEARQLAGKNQIIVLKTMFKKYKIPQVTVDQMNQRTIDAAADSTTPMKAETLIIYSALQELFPARNFFELRKISGRGLLLNGLFLGILNAIERDFASYDMKIMTIQAVWKIDETSASRIYTLYQKEKDILVLIR